APREPRAFRRDRCLEPGDAAISRPGLAFAAEPADRSRCKLTGVPDLGLGPGDLGSDANEPGDRDAEPPAREREADIDSQRMADDVQIGRRVYELGGVRGERAHAVVRTRVRVAVPTQVRGNPFAEPSLLNQAPYAVPDGPGGAETVQKENRAGSGSAALMPDHDRIMPHARIGMQEDPVRKRL